MNIRKLLIFFIICILTNHLNAATLNYNTSDSFLDSSKITNNTELLSYLKNVLDMAGFSRKTSEYLVNIARINISKIDNSDLPDKTRLLKRNLYIFLEEVNEKYKTSAIFEIMQNEYFLSEQYKEPWDYILSKTVLNKFKDNHVYDKVTIEDIHKANDKFCSVWPFCNDN